MQRRQKCGKRSQTLWMQGRVGKKKKSNQGEVEEFLFYGKVGGCSLENQPQSERRGQALPVQSEVAQNITVLHSETPNFVDIDNGTKKTFCSLGINSL